MSVKDVAKQDNWKFTFEKDEGVFFYSPEVIPREAVLHQVTDEYAIYLDENKKPCGVVVEYFEDNFIEHHAPVKEFRSLFSNNEEEVVVIKVDDSSNKDVQQFRELFESLLVVEAFSCGHCECD